MSVKRLELIYTGGTLGMLPGTQGLTPGHDLWQQIQSTPLSAWLQQQDWALSLHPLDPLLDSSHMQPAHWFKLAALIQQRLTQVDALVVVHGTDTLSWTACALYWLLGALDKPVVLTAAQRPLTAENSDAPANLQLALSHASMAGTQGVMLALHGEIWHPEGLRKIDTQHWPAFAAPYVTPLVSGAAVQVLPPAPELAVSSETLMNWSQRPDPLRILRLPLTPGLEDSWLSQQLAGWSQLDGLILEGLGSGNAPRLPASFAQLARLARQGLWIGLISQCWRGQLSDQYAAQLPLDDSLFCRLPEQTPETAEARLACLLTYKKAGLLSHAQVKTYWAINARELQKSGSLDGAPGPAAD